jgi:hypothetical protein
VDQGEVHPELGMVQFCGTLEVGPPHRTPAQERGKKPLNDVQIGVKERCSVAGSLPVRLWLPDGTVRARGPAAILGPPLVWWLAGGSTSGWVESRRGTVGFCTLALRRGRGSRCLTSRARHDAAPGLGSEDRQAEDSASGIA